MSPLITILPNCNTAAITPSSLIIKRSSPILTLSFHSTSSSKRLRFPPRTVSRSHSSPPDPLNVPESHVQSLRVPDHWLSPATALQESEWLRVMLHKWLNDEYCPEETNVEISRVAAKSYYRSLLEKRSDLGEILLIMARDLESISYQESFHGAFSSANAAVDLIAQRIGDGT